MRKPIKGQRGCSSRENKPLQQKCISLKVEADLQTAQQSLGQEQKIRI
jgi:hypothetical protein